MSDFNRIVLAHGVHYNDLICPRATLKASAYIVTFIKAYDTYGKGHNEQNLSDPKVSSRDYKVKPQEGQHKSGDNVMGHP
jgi:hypothetical protein